MSIVSTKKIIIAIIVIIMMLGITTPTFAATKFEFGNIFSSLASITRERVIPAIINFSNKVSRVDNSDIIDIGKNIFGQVNSIFGQVNSKKEGLLGVLTTVSRGFEGITTRLFNIFNNENQSINERTKFAEKARDIKEYIAENNYTYQYKHSGNPYSKNNRTINCSQYVSWVIYEYAKENQNIELESYFKTSRGSKQIYLFMIASSQFEAKGNLSIINPIELQEGDIIVKKVDFIKELEEELGYISEENGGGHIEIFARFDKNSNSPYKVYDAGTQSHLSEIVSDGLCNGHLEEYEVFRLIG